MNIARIKSLQFEMAPEIYFWNMREILIKSFFFYYFTCYFIKTNLYQDENFF